MGWERGGQQMKEKTKSGKSSLSMAEKHWDSYLAELTPPVSAPAKRSSTRPLSPPLTGPGAGAAMGLKHVLCEPPRGRRRPQATGRRQQTPT